ncbi:hypothetical protein V6N13_060071 [Hibiscus sabdariffa]
MRIAARKTMECQKLMMELGVMGHASLLMSYAFCRYEWFNLFSFLMHNSVNISVGEKKDRMMMTGMHTIVDIFCVGCGSILGWKYESAHEKTQKYKEGKFILERFKVLGPDGSNYTVSHEALVSQANHHGEDIEGGDAVQPPLQAPQYPTETLATLGAIGSFRGEVPVISNRIFTLQEHMADHVSQPQLPQDD